MSEKQTGMLSHINKRRLVPHLASSIKDLARFRRQARNSGLILNPEEASYLIKKGIILR